MDVHEAQVTIHDSSKLGELERVYNCPQVEVIVGAF
jgi:hypothetical protein